ncbi:MAG TPA: hypothetical protein VGH14_07890 [Solirubrobacterales bacterium]|jgi:hypothetical protein
MSTLASILSVPLILEFLFAPMNLWTGRTIENFVRFTGFDARWGRMIAAPVKLATAVALIVGLFVPVVGIVGALSALAISIFYVVRLLSPRRRDAAGLFGFALFAVLAAAVAALRIAQG